MKKNYKFLIKSEFDVWNLLPFKRKKVYPENISRSPWSDTQEDFLAALYKENESRTNMFLAKRCAEQFARPVSENAIRGALDRLRKKNRISRFRSIPRTATLRVKAGLYQPPVSQPIEFMMEPLVVSDQELVDEWV